MRYFIGIKLKEESIEKIQKLKDEIKEEILKENIKFTEVKKENIHITLKFIGNYIYEKKLIKIINEIPIKQIPKEIISHRINNFNGKILFLDIKEQEPFIRINNLINKKLNTQENKFHAHITIFRLKNKKINYIKTTNVSLKLNKITLFNSILTPRGPEYETKYEVNL